MQTNPNSVVEIGIIPRFHYPSRKMINPDEDEENSKLPDTPANSRGSPYIPFGSKRFHQMEHMGTLGTVPYICTAMYQVYV